jgi:LuxR family maltose regulon positive regulatory protein
MPVALLGPLVRALALHAAERSVEAGRVLSETIARAAPEGCVRPFRNLGEPLRPLLQAQRTADGGRADSRGFVEQLLMVERLERRSAGAPHALPRADGSIYTLVEPLSAHELEVLVLLAEGVPNQQIVGWLFITERTAKKHVTNILGKLDAATRTQAVALARSAGLLT